MMRTLTMLISTALITGCLPEGKTENPPIVMNGSVEKVMSEMLDDSRPSAPQTTMQTADGMKYTTYTSKSDPAAWSRKNYDALPFNRERVAATIGKDMFAGEVAFDDTELVVSYRTEFTAISPVETEVRLVDLASTGPQAGKYGALFENCIAAAFYFTARKKRPANPAEVEALEDASEERCRAEEVE